MTSRLPEAAITEAPTLAMTGSVLAVHSSATPSSTRKMDQTCWKVKDPLRTSSMYMMSSATAISARQHTVESEMDTPPTCVVQKMRRQTTMKAAIFQSGPQEPRWPVHHTACSVPSFAGVSASPSPLSPGRRLPA